MSVIPSPVAKSDAVTVNQEDQGRINLFATTNSHFCDMKEQIEEKEKELQNLTDASEELMLVDDEYIPYQIGEVFIHMTEDEAQKYLDSAKDSLEEEISKLREKSDEAQKTLMELKVQLYAKFGDNINLEPDES